MAYFLALVTVIAVLNVVGRCRFLSLFSDVNVFATIDHFTNDEVCVGIAALTALSRPVFSRSRLDSRALGGVGNVISGNLGFVCDLVCG